jgi:hypothetical protein
MNQEQQEDLLSEMEATTTPVHTKRLACTHSIQSAEVLGLDRGNQKNWENINNPKRWPAKGSICHRPKFGKTNLAHCVVI